MIEPIPKLLDRDAVVVGLAGPVVGGTRVPVVVGLPLGLGVLVGPAVPLAEGLLAEGLVGLAVGVPSAQVTIVLVETVLFVSLISVISPSGSTVTVLILGRVAS